MMDMNQAEIKRLQKNIVRLKHAIMVPPPRQHSSGDYIDSRILEGYSILYKRLLVINEKKLVTLMAQTIDAMHDN